MRWTAIEAFVSSPLRTIHREPGAKINIRDFEQWSMKDGVERWNVTEMEWIWRQLQNAYDAERAAAALTHKFQSHVQALNIGANIGARCYNLYQGKPSGNHFLEYMEVLICSGVINGSSGTEFKILSLKEDLDSLIDCVKTIKSNATVMDGSKELIDLDLQQGPPRKVLTSTVLGRIKESMLQPDDGFHLLVANCTIFKSEEAHKMMDETQGYRENQEIFTFITLALNVLTEGGSIIIRAHGSVDGFFAANISILYMMFKDVSFLKPLVSLDSHMEFFVIAKGFMKQNFVNFQKKLNESLTNIVFYQSARHGGFPLSKNMVPETFLLSLCKALIPIFRFVIVCKLRNAAFSDLTLDINNTERKITVENIKYEAENSKVKVVSNWMKALSLHKIYYPNAFENDPEVGEQDFEDGEETEAETGAGCEVEVEGKAEVGSEAGEKGEAEVRGEAGAGGKAEVGGKAGKGDEVNVGGKVEEGGKAKVGGESGEGSEVEVGGKAEVEGESGEGGKAGVEIGTGGGSGGATERRRKIRARLRLRYE